MRRNLEQYKGDSNKEIIELYLVNGEEAVTLDDVQKRLLERWTYADELIRKNEMRRETIAKLIMMRFKPLSRITAYQDIVNAEAVFSSSTPLNKKYRIQLRIEFLEMKINELYGMCQMDPADDEEGNKVEEKDEDVMTKIARIKNNQEYLHEAKELEKVLQKYYHDYPDTTITRSPKNIIFNINYNKMPAPSLTVDEALKLDKQIINIIPNDNGSDK